MEGAITRQLLSPKNRNSKPCHPEQMTCLRQVKGEMNDFSLPRTRVPHIWPGFGQMWEGTNARGTVQIVPEDFQGEICEFPHLANRRRDMGHPPILFIRTGA